jgi:hypothetical protein
VTIGVVVVLEAVARLVALLVVVPIRVVDGVLVLSDDPDVITVADMSAEVIVCALVVE